MRIPSVTDLDRDPLDVIETGDWVKVDGDTGTVEVTKKSQTEIVGASSARDSSVDQKQRSRAKLAPTGP
jgi:phosphoenolpyruvate-protein kinase (PTS system EI component)